MLDPYLYRFYPRTGHYLAVTERTVLVLGPLTNDQVLVVGTLDDFACVADLARCVAPTLVRQPQGATVAPGVEVVFSAEVGGGPALRLQWLRDGEPIAGANSASLSFTAAAADNGARFSLRAENAKGATANGMDGIYMVGVGVGTVGTYNDELMDNNSRIAMTRLFLRSGPRPPATFPFPVVIWWASTKRWSSCRKLIGWHSERALRAKSEPTAST